MSAVIVVFVAWFAVVAVLAAIGIARAQHFHAPRWWIRLREGFDSGVDAASGAVGRVVTTAVVLLAGWSVVLIVGWFMGLWAHRLQGLIDEPTFHFWQRNHLDGSWADLWNKLTNIGAPKVTQGLALVAAVAFGVLYRVRGFRAWWAPSVIMIVGYLAEKYSQTILKLVVHRGHPPTRLGTWPSGGMGRLVDVYGLILFFAITLYWPHSRRAWALGASALALLASIQAYARLVNLEHWVTDVVGGGIYGLLLLSLMVIGYRTLSRDQLRDTPLETVHNRP